MGSRAATKVFKGEGVYKLRDMRCISTYISMNLNLYYICYNPGGLNIYYTRRMSICQVISCLFTGVPLYVAIYTL